VRAELASPTQAREVLVGAGLHDLPSESADGICLLLRDGVNVLGVLELENLAFDSRIFGRPMVRIGLLAAPNEAGYRVLLAACEVECRKRGVAHAVRRLPVGQFAENWGLSDAGYRLVDVSVLFERESGSPPAPSSSVRAVRAVRPDEHESLAVQFAKSFTLTRFAVDPFCSEQATTELHHQWLLNSCRGRADAVLVVDGKDSLQGFVTCRVDSATQTGSIELIAVDAGSRGAGVGKSLVAGALDWFHDRVRRVHVRTQLNNQGAITLYQTSGFRLKLGELTYCRIFEETAVT
jgi:ribosomal protein S18 acetylase RimI-like enzyme